MDDYSSSDEEMEMTLREQGNDHFKHKEYEEAIHCYTKAIAGEPEASLYGNRAAAYLMIEDYNSAIVDAKKSIELDPAFVKGYMRIARCEISFGNFRSALSYLDQGLTHEPSNSSLRLEKARLTRVEKVIENIKQLIAERKFVEALGTLGCDILKGCHFAQLCNLQARCLLGMREYEKALSISSNALRLESQNTEAMEVRGLALMYTGNSSSAIQHFQQALRLDPDNKACRDNLRQLKKIENLKKEGNGYFSSRQWAKAEETYSEALFLGSCDPQMNKALYSNRAAARNSQSKFKEALSDCNKALEIDPSYLRCLLRRADVHTKMEMYEEAVQDFEKAKELDPNSKDIEHQLRQAKIELKRSKRKDYYKILDCPRHFTSSELKKKYHKAALKWHPDKHDGDEAKEIAEAKFKDVNEAYSVLNDPEKKALYDAGKDPNDPNAGMNDGFEGGGMDPADLFSMFGGMGGMGGMGGGRRGGRAQHFHFDGGFGAGGPGYQQFQSGYF